MPIQNNLQRLNHRFGLRTTNRRPAISAAPITKNARPQPTAAAFPVSMLVERNEIPTLKKMNVRTKIKNTNVELTLALRAPPKSRVARNKVIFAPAVQVSPTHFHPQPALKRSGA
jgi:hypothetical protein